MRNTEQEIEHLLKLALEAACTSKREMLAHFISMALVELKEPEELQKSPSK